MKGEEAFGRGEGVGETFEVKRHRVSQQVKYTY